MRFIISFGSMILGFVLIWKTFALSRIMGMIPWAEKNFGGGGTYILLKLVGLLFIVFGLAYMFGVLDIALSPFRHLFGR